MPILSKPIFAGGGRMSGGVRGEVESMATVAFRGRRCRAGGGARGSVDTAHGQENIFSLK